MANELDLLQAVFPEPSVPDDQAWARVRRDVSAAIAAEKNGAATSFIPEIYPKGSPSNRRGLHFKLSAAITAIAAAALVVALIVLPSQGRGSLPQTVKPAAGWSFPAPFHLDPGTIGPETIACPTTSVCYVTGSWSPSPHSTVIKALAYVTDDGGSTWRQLNLPKGLSLLTGFSCPTTTWCMAVAQLPNSFVSIDLSTQDGGANWNENSIPQAVTLSTPHLTCIDTSTCFAFTTAEENLKSEQAPKVLFMRTDDWGRHWSERALPWIQSPQGASPASFQSPSASFSCPTVSSCVGLVTMTTKSRVPNKRILTLEWRTHNGGNSWASSWVYDEGGKSVQSGSAFYPSVVCWDAVDCLAIAPVVPTSHPVPQAQLAFIETTDGGLHWQKAGMTAEMPYANSFTCLPGGLCAVTAFHAAYFSSNGGRSWFQRPLPTGAANAYNLTCASASSCFLVGFPAQGAASFQLFTDNAIRPS